MLLHIFGVWNASIHQILIKILVESSDSPFLGVGEFFCIIVLPSIEFVLTLSSILDLAEFCLTVLPVLCFIPILYYIPHLMK